LASTIIAVSNQKGGVGKTTTAVHLSAGLAKRGRRVLLIDADTQGHSAVWLGRSRLGVGFGEFLSGKALQHCLVADVRPGLDLMPPGNLFSVQAMVAEEGVASSARLRLQDSSYDYIMVDCGPSWMPLHQALVYMADEVLCPVTPDYASLSGLLDAAGRVAQLRGEHATIAYVTPTMVDRRVKRLVEPALGALSEGIWAEVITPEIPVCAAVSRAFGVRQTIFEFEPRSSASQAYERLVDYLIEHEELE
jgi:chromosome partitioning protein